MGRHRVGLLLVGVAMVAHAKPQVSFGPHDVPFLFGIPKSDNPNHVQFGIHLDPSCRPVGSAPIVPYWREYTKGDGAPLLALSWLDETAYGIQSQVVLTSAPDGGGGDPSVVLRLRNFPSRVIGIHLSRAASGSCRGHAETVIAGQDAVLKNVWVQLDGPFINHVEIRGESRDGGVPLAERLRR